MKSKTILVMSIFAISLCSFAFTYSTQSIDTDPCGFENTSFVGGEKLVYKLYYNYGLLWIPAGEAAFTVKENKNNYELFVTGKTYKSYETFFKVNDYFYSKIDKETLLPYNFVRKIEEGNYRLYDSIRFDQARKMAFSYHGKSKSQATSQVHQLNNCMQDIISNVYYLRNVNASHMKKGDKLGTEMFFDKNVYPIQIGFGGNETKEIKGLGEFRTKKFVPSVVAGNVFKEDDQLTVWVSDDRNQIPLMIESPISVGSVKAVLKSYSGLKHVLSSKI